MEKELAQNEDRFLTVTEVAGDDVTQEQIDRICHRYYWAGDYVQGKDVVEVACGTGQGLGFLAKKAKSLSAGDISPEILSIAKKHYGNRFELRALDAQNLPYEDRSKDVIILFEALYYLPSFERFILECRRVLRSDGLVLIATANKDLFDFNPSPFSHRYYGVPELKQAFQENGFEVSFFGHLPVGQASLRQRVLRPIKKIAVELNLVPKTMAGKKLIKRLVFGGLRPMPPEIAEGMSQYSPPVKLSADRASREHKVVYCVARILSEQ